MRLLLAVMLAALAHCGDDIVPVSDAVQADFATTDGQIVDAAVGIDAAVGMDAAVMDATVTTDAAILDAAPMDTATAGDAGSGVVLGYHTPSEFYGDNPFRNLSPSLWIIRLAWLGKTLVGIGGGQLMLLDLSTPTAPIIAKSISTGWSGDMITGPDNRIYVANTPNVDVFAADLTSLGSIPGPSNVGGLAFAGSNLVIIGNGILVSDVTDPTSPKQISLTPFAGGGSALSVAVDGTLAAISTTKGLELWSLADPTAPVLLGGLANLTIYTQVVLAPGEAILTSTYGLVLVDISDPTTPKIAATHLPLQTVRMVLDGTTMYLPPQAGGAALEVLDVSIASSPTRLGSLADGSGAYDVALDANWIYMATGDGMMVVPKSDAANFPFTVPLPDYALHLASDDTRVFVTDASAGLYTFSLANPARPAVIDQISGFPYADDVCVAGTQLLYAPDYDLQIYDLSAAGAPVFQSSLTGFASSVTAATGRVFVSDGGAVSIYDWSNPAVPSLLSTTSPASSYGIARLVATSTRLYAAFPSLPNVHLGGLYVFDISTPSAPTLLGTYYLLGGEGLAADDTHAFVANGGNITIIDVTTPHNETIRRTAIPGDVTEFLTSCYVRSLTLDQGRLLAGCDSEGVQVYDVTNPSLPWLEGAYQTPSFAQQAIVQNGFIYAANWDSGLTTIPYAPIQLTRAGTIAEGAILDYTATWAAPQSFERSACTVSAGSCQVTSFDATAGTATIEWTLPSSPGDATLTFAIGTWQRFTRARDTLTVP
jgi:hypothetical protein